MSSITRRVGELSDITIQQEDKRIRIEKQHKPGKVTLILAIEKAWEKYAYDRVGDDEKGIDQLNKLLRLLQDGPKGLRSGMLCRKAEYYGNKYRNIRLSSHDFEEAFWKEALRVIESFSWATDYYLYETLDHAFERRANDVFRKAKAKKRSIDHRALPLSQGFEHFYADKRVNVENEVVDKLSIQELLSGDILSEDERKYIEVRYENLDASYQELAKLMGYKHHESVRRIENRIKRKLTLVLERQNVEMPESKSRTEYEAV